MAKKGNKKGLLDKAIDAVTSRDEKEAATEALEEAAEARSRAAREAAGKTVSPGVGPTSIITHETDD